MRFPSLDLALSVGGPFRLFRNSVVRLTFPVSGNTLIIAMKWKLGLLPMLTSSILLAPNFFTYAGTWSDSFSENFLGSDWQGDRDYFSITNGALKGISAAPIGPVPLHLVEVGKDWTDYTVQCRINVVTPNLLICTKGALVLRDNGTDGYVFALHVATQTIEVYRLSDHEMLLSKDSILVLGQWYLVRAELQGTKMSFFVDDELIGTVTDERSLSGAAGVAVQDTLESLFADFTVTGPNIPSNGLDLSVGQMITLSWPSALTNCILQSTSQLLPGTTWEMVTNIPTSIGDQLTVTLQPSPGNRFYRLVSKGP